MQDQHQATECPSMGTCRLSKPRPGGRPPVSIDLPEIEALAKQGLGCQAIATVLSERRGQPVSMTTVWRRLAALRAEQGTLL